MSPSKFKIETFDPEGNRLTITLEGNVSRKRALRLLDLIELMGGLSRQPTVDNLVERLQGLTKLERIKALVTSKFSLKWFSSKELQALYKQVFGEPIGLTTVGTYLQRMYQENLLLRSGSRAGRRYRLNQNLARAVDGMSFLSDLDDPKR